MKNFAFGVGVVLSLELKQRVRGVAFYVLLGIFVGLVALVTVSLSLAFSWSQGGGIGAGIFSTIIYFVLLLGTLIAPALSGNAINGDRDAGTLATTQVTLISTGQLIIGKFLAAWLTALAFLIAVVPFLIYAAVAGAMPVATIVVSTLVLAVELGVIAAIGVGLSGILTRPLISVVVSYLTVAALSVGTLITFMVGGLAVQTTVTTTTSYGITYDSAGNATECETSTYTNQLPRFDLFWGALVANPYVLLADAVPTTFTDDYPDDLFGTIKLGVRSLQIPQGSQPVYDECDPSNQQPTPREVIDSTVPGWFVGLGIHLVLAAGALIWAWRRTDTPAGKLTKGSRIA